MLGIFSFPAFLNRSFPGITLLGTCLTRVAGVGGGGGGDGGLGGAYLVSRNIAEIQLSP